MRLCFRLTVLAALLTICFSAVTFQSAKGQDASPSLTQDVVPLIQAVDLQSLIAKKSHIILVDVREQTEFDQGHIDGAFLIPLGSLPDRYTLLPKNIMLVVYCHSGHRSAKAVTFLRAHGYTRAFSLAGGFQEWTTAHPLKLVL